MKNQLCIANSINISYQSLYYLRKKILDSSSSDDINNFSYLLPYYEKLKSRIAGTIAKIDLDEDNRFKSTFLMIGKIAEIYEYVIPVIYVDGCHLKNRFGGVILSASVLDGAGHLIPLSIGLYGSECYESWKSFLVDLREGLDVLKPTSIKFKSTVFVSDREKGLIAAFQETLPQHKHIFCSVHICKNLKSRFKITEELSNLFFQASRTCSNEEFYSTMNKIQSIDSNVFEYLNALEPQLWTISHSNCDRWGVITSNSAESLNSWIEDLRHLSHFKIINGFVDKSMHLIGI